MYWYCFSNEVMAFIVTKHNKIDNRILKLNVGFLLKESAGYSREITFNHQGELKAEEVSITRLHGSLRLTRTPQGILIQDALHAQTPTKCTRCLKPFEMPFTIEFSDLFVFPKGPDPLDPYYVDDNGIINLVPIIREETILSIPMQVLCSPDCKGLCSECGQDLNEGTCDCKSEHFDPRLASLRALLTE